jgi:hypothetical protein
MMTEVAEIVIPYVRGKLADGCTRFEGGIVERLLDEYDRVQLEVIRLRTIPGCAESLGVPVDALRALLAQREVHK